MNNYIAKNAISKAIITKISKEFKSVELLERKRN